MKAAAEQKLIKKNINPTAMRILVMELLLKQTSAISLSDMERVLLPADRITIYRSIKTFAEKGLVHVVNDGTGSPKYAVCLDDCNANEHHDLHVHFFCSNCRETFCLPNSKIPLIALPDGFSSAETELIVKGVCRECKINAMALH